ncbi:DUF6265 family protein [Brevundimonas goettingensis]|uniref:DUF6265 domain-containing protein n=1 Tax=Brevundimonas goettingensis TaxID=2774190 RepID=A0A975C0L1_9CAUL|nr:DUF6265 family protein [Brevundimonas goettingensis]QTC90677.1 hypothetical protein IFJ75_15750 [Brevundimonas goettingensis]
MILSTFAAALVLQSTPVTADQLSWMSGYWLSCDGGREVSETWSDARGGLMLGTALTLEGGKLTGFETSRISPQTPAGGNVSYFAGVNGAPPVAFAAREASGTRVVFENAGHDFPQRVIYERVGDVLNARIEGHMDDRDQSPIQSMSWSYRKADLNTRCPT